MKVFGQGHPSCRGHLLILEVGSKLIVVASFTAESIDLARSIAPSCSSAASFELP